MMCPSLPTVPPLHDRAYRRLLSASPRAPRAPRARRPLSPWTCAWAALLAFDALWPLAVLAALVLYAVDKF